MPDLRELYQDVIVEHSKAPRNYRVIQAANRKVEGFNPLCGDHFTIYLLMDGDVIRDIGFQGSGCAISTASTSIMTQIVKGKTKDEAEQIFEKLRSLVTGKAQEAQFGPELGKLSAFAGVSEFPARVKCATLAWHALHNALEGKLSASTE